MMSCSPPLRAPARPCRAAVELAHDGRGIAQVGDGLEQRHHDQVGVASVSSVPCSRPTSFCSSSTSSRSLTVSVWLMM
jgi:hypothetical protein